MPSAVIDSTVVFSAPARITFVNPIVDAFASTTMNVTVARVPSPSEVAPKATAASGILLSVGSI